MRMAEGGSAAAAAELQHQIQQQQQQQQQELPASVAHASAPFLPGMRDRAGGSLLILVPTVARRGVDYLTRTVDSLLGEARAGRHGFDKVAVRVVGLLSLPGDRLVTWTWKHGDTKRH